MSRLAEEALSTAEEEDIPVIIRVLLRSLTVENAENLVHKIRELEPQLSESGLLLCVQVLEETFRVSSFAGSLSKLLFWLPSIAPQPPFFPFVRALVAHFFHTVSFFLSLSSCVFEGNVVSACLFCHGCICVDTTAKSQLEEGKRMRFDVSTHSTSRPSSCTSPLLCQVAHSTEIVVVPQERAEACLEKAARRGALTVDTFLWVSLVPVQCLSTCCCCR